MPQNGVNQHLSVTQRKEIFLALVDAQDEGFSVPQSRKAIVERFAVTERQLRQIEQEGLDNGWPPL